MPDHPSTIEAIARATRLSEPRLVDAWFPTEPATVSLRARVCALGCDDEQAVERVVRRLLDQQHSLLDEIHWLCRAMGQPQRGLPFLRPGLLARRLSRIVAPDALFPFFPGLELPTREPFDWPAVPLIEGGRTAPLLRDGSVDSHIHLGGTLPPVFYWLPLMGGGLHLDILRELPATERGHADASTWQAYVGRAIWRRLWLAAQLERGSRQGRLFPWLERDWIDLPDLAADADARLFAGPESLAPILRFKQKYADDARELAIDLDDREDWTFPDPLRPPRPSDNAGTYDAGERRFLYHLGRHLEHLKKDLSANVDPDEVSRLEDGLREYLIIRNAFHRLMVYDRGHEGLLRFNQSFRRRSFLFGRRPRLKRRQRRHLRTLVTRLERARMEAGLDSQLVEPFTPGPQGPGAADGSTQRRIEMRVSVPGAAEMRATLRAWINGLCDHIDSSKSELPRPSQIGLIFHFIKQGNEPEHAQIALDDADRLEWVLRTEPWFRRLVVGIDAAGQERRGSPRIFLKAFHQLRRLQTTFRPEPGESDIRLGYTYHVGEDVDDLLTGLRHMDEAVSLLIPRGEGGRLGHALALGEKVKRFYRRRGVTEPCLGSHLLDLVWARGRLVEIRKSSWIPWLTSRIRRLCDGLLRGSNPDPQKCFDRMCLDRELGREDLLREDQLFDFLVENLGRCPDLNAPSPVPLKHSPWLELVEFLQTNLRDRVAHRRICVEANPTSNLIIGDYKDYDELPYRRLVEAGIAVSLNTDDPGLFMTNLPGELAAMYDGLEARGELKHQEILDWLKDRLLEAKQGSFLDKQIPFGPDAVELCEPWRDSD